MCQRLVVLCFQSMYQRKFLLKWFYFVDRLEQRGRRWSNWYHQFGRELEGNLLFSSFFLSIWSRNITLWWHLRVSICQSLFLLQHSLMLYQIKLSICKNSKGFHCEWKPIYTVDNVILIHTIGNFHQYFIWVLSD